MKDLIVISSPWLKKKIDPGHYDYITAAISDLLGYNATVIFSDTLDRSLEYFDNSFCERTIRYFSGGGRKWLDTLISDYSHIDPKNCIHHAVGNKTFNTEEDLIDYFDGWVPDGTVVGNSLAPTPGTTKVAEVKQQTSGIPSVVRFY